jgi:hypothetical protein
VEERKPKSDYKYTYPYDLKLKPDTPDHDELVQLFVKKIQASYDVMSTRYATWADVDRMLTAFIPLDEEEKRDKKEDDRRPISVVVPVSYAALETLLTYQVAAFLTEYPFLRYTSTDTADDVGVAKLQAFIGFDCYKMKFPLKQHSLWRDSFAYGISAGFCTWERKVGYRTRTKVFDDTLSGIGASINKTYVKDKELVVRREGNDITVIDPFNFFPDPSVPLENLQKGEFVGFVESTTIVDLLRKEQTQGYFNVRYLLDKEGSLESKFNNKKYTGRYDRTDFDPSVGSLAKQVDVLHIMVDVIPSQFGFGDSDYPEKWFVGIAGDSTIVYIVPGGHHHGDFPIVVDAPNFDGHSIIPISMIEMTAGLQKSIDWTFRTHWANARKVINDVLIVNPNKIHMPDLLKPGPKIVRTAKSAAFGGTLDEAVKQLQVTDVTGNYMNDISNIMGLMNFVLGSTPSVNSGVGRRTGERVTATEITNDRQSSMSRLQKVAKMSAWQSMFDTATLFAYHTQQYLDHDVYVKVMGELDEELTALLGSNKTVAVSPMDLDVDFDVMVSDGTIPWSTDPQTAAQMFQMISQNEQLLQRFDVVKLFKILAKSMNINVGNIELKPKVVPNEQIEKDRQAGNIVPAEEYYEGKY